MKEHVNFMKSEENFKSRGKIINFPKLRNLRRGGNLKYWGNASMA